MKVAHACGYYSELAVKAGKPRPRNPPFWESYMFCHAVKSGEFHRRFYIDKQSGRLNITKANFPMVRPTFGDWAARKLPTFSEEPVLLVPVPSKDGVKTATTYRSLRMAQEALKGTAYEGSIFDGLRWNKKLKSAHDGGPRKRAELLPHLETRGDLKDKKVVLIDDLVTTGGSLLACQDRIEGAGAKVVGAITCGRTVYDASEPPFKAREFELTEELSDYRPPPAPPPEDPFA
jgi:hypothetical protein